MFPPVSSGKFKGGHASDVCRRAEGQKQNNKLYMDCTRRKEQGMTRVAMIIACVAVMAGAIFFFSTGDASSLNPVKIVKQQVVKNTLLADMGL